MFLVLYFCEICFISAVQKGKPVELLCTVVKSVMVLVKYLYIDTLSFPKYVWRMKSSALIYVSFMRSVPVQCYIMIKHIHLDI